MKKKIMGSIMVLTALVLIVVLGRPIGSTPALGILLSPTHGFWNNIDPNAATQYAYDLDGPVGKVKVIIDERGVPHIFADNEQDLYFAQGFVVAKDRLWQMDFVSYYASGRLTEIVGKDALEIDRYNRRIGLMEAAKNSLEVIMKDERTKTAVLQFEAGVNAYIAQLKVKDYPIEYKLLGYAPEKWNAVKSSLLLKYMANDLTGSDTDIEMTNALRLFGREIFDQLYPDLPSTVDPIVPLDTKFNFQTVSTDKKPFKDSSLALIDKPFKKFEPEKGLGSNNWAVGKDRTITGRAFLCNDPHLALRLPSIWYEMQLNAPGINVYGVTIPGAPGIIIGYNKKVAWGVTNAGMDVRDWYSVQNKAGDDTQYLVGGTYKHYDIHNEKYIIRGSEPYNEQIKWTVVGPVVYDQSFSRPQDKTGLAMSWTAHRGSNELLTFYLLNRASNHQDYLAALDNYWCPGQNFVYADAEGNVALKEQGRFWVRAKEQGKFVQSLATADTNAIQHNFIPNEQNPYTYNPSRGFVSSANQVPVGPEYPYYIHGGYENYRNRRINEVLANTPKATVYDMEGLQNDTKSIIAAEVLPYLLTQIDSNQSGISNKIFKELKKWNYYADYQINAPSYFYKWWEYIEQLAWDEFKQEKVSLSLPENYTTVDLLKKKPEFALFDIVATTHKKENAGDIIRQAFDSTVIYFDKNKKEEEFRIFKNTSLTHLARLEPFSQKYVPVGGYINIVNATSSRWGASWRMIVDFASGNPQGRGVYPGGQSGNPGSSLYTSFADAWAKGKYYQHHYFSNMEEALLYLTKNK